METVERQTTFSNRFHSPINSDPIQQTVAYTKLLDASSLKKIHKAGAKALFGSLKARILEHPLN
jgi:hypothetical protein